MDFKQLFKLIKRWYWLLITGLFLGAAGGILYSRIQTPVYEATAKVLVMRAPDETLAALAYLSPTELATTFSQLITTQPVLDDLSSKLEVQILKTQIQIQLVSDSQILKVTADADTPEMAAKIANGLIETSIQHYVDMQSRLFTESETNVQAQLNEIQTKISNTQIQIAQTSDLILNDQMTEIQSEMSPLQDEMTQLQVDIAQISPITIATTADQKTRLAKDQARVAQIQPLLAAYQEVYNNLLLLKTPIATGSTAENSLTLLQSDLDQYQKNYAQLKTRLEDLQHAETQGISNAVEMEKAIPPLTYIRPQVLMNTLLTSAVGLALAIVAVFMMENLEVSIKIPDIFRRNSAKGKERKVKDTARI